MPIYEYRCESCGHQQEFLQKVGEAPLTVCPRCAKPTFKKMVTAAGFQLKGSGWYVTDFRNKPSSKPAAKNESKSDSTAGESKSSESKSTGDAKPSESKPAESKPATPSKPAASSGDA